LHHQRFCKEKKEKKKAKKRRIEPQSKEHKSFAALQDNVEFGEVVERPPTLSAVPKQV
jgi:hypothetical protein